MRPLSRSLRALLLAVAVACTPSAVAPSAQAARSALPADRIQLLHTDDIHGHLEAETVRSGATSFQQAGMAALAGQVSAYRARAPERTLLLDSGDAWQGTFISNANKGEAVTKAMSLMRYDGMAVGNHDFDWGQDVLAQRAKEATFPFLGANVVDASGKIPAYLAPYVVRDVGVAKVGILGLTFPGAAGIIKATSIAGLRFLPAAETVKRYLPELRGSADVIVVAAHMGAADSAQLAQDVPDAIDVIVAGHDHQPLRTARAVGKTTIVDAGAYAENLGHLELTLDPATHHVTAAQRADELVAIAAGQTKTDPDVARLVEERRADGEKYTARIVGRTVAALDNPREECGLGNLITDAFVDYGRAQGWKTDVAFYNMAGVRAPLPAGEISYGKLYQVLPFTNTIVSVDLSGAVLREVLEAASGSAGRLHIGGGAWAYRFANPAGQRVLSATVGGQPLDTARVYHVATIDYLLLGGDGHSEFAKGTNVIYGDIEVDVVAAYLTAHSPVDPRVEGRIQQR